jgi:hypothetical protein
MEAPPDKSQRDITLQEVLVVFHTRAQRRLQAFIPHSYSDWFLLGLLALSLFCSLRAWVCFVKEYKFRHHAKTF